MSEKTEIDLEELCAGMRDEDFLDASEEEQEAYLGTLDEDSIKALGVRLNALEQSRRFNRLLDYIAERAKSDKHPKNRK